MTKEDLDTLERRWAARSSGTNEATHDTEQAALAAMDYLLLAARREKVLEERLREALDYVEDAWRVHWPVGSLEHQVALEIDTRIRAALDTNERPSAAPPLPERKG